MGVKELRAHVFVCVFFCGSVYACKPDGIALESNAGTVWISTEPSKINVSQPFQVRLNTCQTEGQLTSVEVDAWMPMHNHGMNYAPKILKTADHLYEAEGFLFHMPGQWQFTIELNFNDQKEELTWDLSVE